VTRLDGKVVLPPGEPGGSALRASPAATVASTGSSQASVDAGCTAMPAAAADNGLDADLPDADTPAGVARRGRLDVLINNAGVMDGSPDPFAATVEERDRIMAIDLRAPFFASRAAADTMRTAGGGSSIMLGSIAGQIGGTATGSAYVASKAGIEGLTRALARQLAPLGIRAKCIAPSGIETDMVAAWPAEARDRVTAMTPLGRFGRSDEVTHSPGTSPAKGPTVSPDRA